MMKVEDEDTDVNSENEEAQGKKSFNNIFHAMETTHNFYA